jgi:hypothetical protein
MQPQAGLPFQFQAEDTILLIPMAIGLLLTFIGGIWLLVRGFQEHVLWGLALLFIPCSGIIFLFAHFKKAIVPTLLSILGGVFIAAPIGIMSTRVVKVQDTVDTREVTSKARDPRGETIEVKEEAITLTGAKREDYGKLGKSKNWAIVQWANKDVTDDDIELLHGCKLVRSIDLSDTQISDEGLHVLDDFEKLEILKLARTKISEAAFVEHIQPIETLMELDLRGTKVPEKILKEWKAAKMGRKYLK